MTKQFTIFIKGRQRLEDYSPTLANCLLDNTTWREILPTHISQVRFEIKMNLLLLLGCADI
jgi:hypothetical protein